ncbi:MAG TPA: Gfo/Idh/MocA family oxidoreductase [Roseiflexaceae bacterium]|nr:Gfo/Idh/MocA family oxidoreductase [Roseiflexaceae bacterium]
MSNIRLAIVGCGGMGHRHLYGLNELHRAGWRDFTLVAACDPLRANAESLADQAASFFGARPAVVATLEELASLGVDAVDITTTPRSHHTIAVEALARNWHTMVEKPLGLTVRAANAIVRAAASSGRVLSVAENYRRDPVNRLAKALLQAGVIGAPRFVIHHVVDGGRVMLISVWRHQKDQSGVLLDVGVHYADMLEYLLGEIDIVYAQTRLHEPMRSNPAASGGAAANPAGVYGRWQKEMPATFAATAEDAVYGTLLFASGVVGQYIEDHAGCGEHLWARQIHGSEGSLSLPVDRSGGTIALRRGRQEEIRGAALLDLVPDFRLDPVTAALFGGERLAGFELPFAETDRKLIAVEYADFASAIRGERPPEVGAAQGARSVAVSYALLESGALGRPVSVAEVLAEQVSVYQREIDVGLGLGEESVVRSA